MTPEELKRMHHDACNALAIVRATLEGMADGLVQPEPARFESMCASLERVREMLDELLLER